MNGILKPALFAATAVALILLFACWQANAEPIRLDMPRVEEAACERERMLGILARQRLAQLVGSGIPEEEARRLLAVEGWAAEWTGERKEWCEVL